MSHKKTVNPFSESSEQLAKEFDEAAMDNNVEKIKRGIPVQNKHKTYQLRETS